MLQKLLEIQNQIQIRAYPITNRMSMDEKILSNTRALIHEVIEVEREVNYKFWKTPKPVDIDKLKSEIVDVFIFLLNLINASGMTEEELVYLTLEKMGVNIDRQINGY